MTAGSFLHPLGNFNPHQFQSRGQRLVREMNQIQEKLLSIGIGLTQNMEAVIEIVERLRESEGVFGESCGFLAGDGLIDNHLQLRRQESELPIGKSIVAGEESPRAPQSRRRGQGSAGLKSA